MKTDDNQVTLRMWVSYMFALMTHARFVKYLKKKNVSDEEITASLVCDRKLPRSYAIRADLALNIARDWKKEGKY